MKFKHSFYIGHESLFALKRLSQGVPARHRQGGVALITVLMVAFFAVLLTANMSEQQSLDIRRTTNYLGVAQAKAYALAAEDISIIALKEDLDADIEKGRMVDHGSEAWSGYKTSGLSSERISGGLSDLNGKFNLNWLRDPQFPQARTVFKNLLSNLDSPSTPEQGVSIDLVNALVDWLDADDIPQGVDGEDLYYLGLDPPYRAANNYLVDVSELRLVKGFSDVDIKKLEPYVSVLPRDSKLNLNTADLQVLQAFESGLNAAQIVDNRGEEGYDTVQAAITGNGIRLNDLSTDIFSVRSSYFALDGSAQVNDRRVTIYSVIYRPEKLDEDNQFEIVSRDFGKKFLVLNIKDEV